jgi:hypothetical protein
MGQSARVRRLRRGALALCALWLAAPAVAPAAGPPSLGTTWVAEVAPESATANAFVDPNGLATAWRFEYLTDAAYAANLGAGREGFYGASVSPAAGEAPPISSPQIVSWPLGGLVQSTTYHLRTVAESGGGAVASLAPPLFSTTSTLIPCVGDACQPLPSAPEDPTPGTQVPSLGNPPISFPPEQCPKSKRRAEHKGRVSCVPKARHGRNRRGGGGSG